LNTTVIVIAVLYLIICTGIGIWATKQTKTNRDFFIAGGNLGMIVMAMAAFTSLQSGFGLVGGAGLTFNGGLGFVTGLMITASLGVALTWFLIGKRMWNFGKLGEIFTIGDVVELRYKSKAARGWISFAIVLGVLGYLGTQVQAMGIVMNTIFGVSPMVGAIIGLGILGIYSVGGGMVAGAYTDLFQGIIMVVVSIIVFFIAIDIGGGLLNITQTLQGSEPILGTPFGTYPFIMVACWIFMISLGAAGQPHFITKFLMVGDVKKLKWGALTASVGYMMTTFLVIGIGLTAAALNIQGKFPAIDSPDQALTTFLVEFTPPIVAGLVIAGIMAAIMSTGDSFVNIGAACIVRDIPKAFGIEVKNELLWSRIAVASLLVISTIFSFYMDTLVALLGVFGWGTFASAIFPSVVLGLVWKQATKQGAIASIIVALLINFILEIGGKYGLVLLPPGVVNGAFSLAASIVVFIIVSLLTQKTKAALDPKVETVIEG
jgi:sodium/proline symporter